MEKGGGRGEERGKKRGKKQDGRGEGERRVGYEWKEEEKKEMEERRGERRKKSQMRGGGERRKKSQMRGGGEEEKTYQVKNGKKRFQCAHIWKGTPSPLMQETPRNVDRHQTSGKSRGRTQARAGSLAQSKTTSTTKQEYQSYSEHCVYTW